MQRATLESFLAPISKQLGHESVPQEVTPLDYQKDAPARVTDGLDHAAIVDMFAAESEKIRVDVHRCSKADAGRLVAEIVSASDAGVSVVFSDDERLDALGIPAALDACDAASGALRWDASMDRDELTRACNEARFGITYAQGGIAETGTIVQPCSKTCGRAISLLPLEHIALVDADSVKATMGDWLHDLGARELPAQVCFISGPSVTSDIELVRVEGVHGPMRVHYVIVE